MNPSDNTSFIHFHQQQHRHEEHHAKPIDENTVKRQIERNMSQLYPNQKPKRSKKQKRWQHTTNSMSSRRCASSSSSDSSPSSSSSDTSTFPSRHRRHHSSSLRHTHTQSSVNNSSIVIFEDSMPEGNGENSNNNNYNEESFSADVLFYSSHSNHFYVKQNMKTVQSVCDAYTSIEKEQNHINGNKSTKTNTQKSSFYWMDLKGFPTEKQMAYEDSHNANKLSVFWDLVFRRTELQTNYENNRRKFISVLEEVEAKKLRHFLSHKRREEERQRRRRQQPSEGGEAAERPGPHEHRGPEEEEAEEGGDYDGDLLFADMYREDEDMVDEDTIQLIPFYTTAATAGGPVVAPEYGLFVELSTLLEVIPHEHHSDNDAHKEEEEDAPPLVSLFLLCTREGCITWCPRATPGRAATATAAEVCGYRLKEWDRLQEMLLTVLIENNAKQRMAPTREEAPEGRARQHQLPPEYKAVLPYGRSSDDAGEHFRMTVTAADPSAPLPKKTILNTAYFVHSVLYVVITYNFLLTASREKKQPPAPASPPQQDSLSTDTNNTNNNNTRPVVSFATKTYKNNLILLLSEADTADQVLPYILPETESDQADALRRILLLRRRINYLKSKLYTKLKVIELFCLATPFVRTLAKFVLAPLPLPAPTRLHQHTNAVNNGMPNSSSRWVHQRTLTDLQAQLQYALRQLDQGRSILANTTLLYSSAVVVENNTSSTDTDFYQLCITYLVLLVMPLTVLASQWGMNCAVPWKWSDSLVPFGLLVAFMAAVALSVTGYVFLMYCTGRRHLLS